ncbi:Kelch motif [Venustampulla echinocandica]|uniref:Kelch motif n=1 Tax=Venustampulla echinocandica TaxID=2656787 RepID=A0A370TFB3_9HELO|nr:Kelch motif [Venustampulla echinocandica]RDL33587.1 Kelch motif [Venustampulla echinocandica]
MADKLTLERKGSLRSGLSPPSSAVEDDSGPSPERGDFLAGVRKGIRKWGSVSGGRARPPNIQVGESSTSTSTDPDPALASASTGNPRTPLTTRKKHERSRSNLNQEKPLPRTPISPTSPAPKQPSVNTFSPPDTPKVFAEMSRPAASGSRTSTMDSMTSDSTAPMYAGGFKPASSTYLADMTSSQGSIASSGKQEADDDKEITTPRSNGPPSAGPSPAQPRSAGGATGGTPGAPSSAHLSGLMCNVHRTTGREPHPLVGATTTILGDKLYVFGGRILSRSKPSLTSDLYELDLIRRHWTKVDTLGDVPPPRYFHSVCPLGDTKLVCYGGMSPAPTQGQNQQVVSAQNVQDAQPEVVVMSDIYIYDAPTRTWTFVPTQETPQGRYAHCATILPSSATFSSVNAPSSAIHHNPSGSNPNQGSIGVNIDGTGGAEMVVVGGQDSANHYIEQISVFNLRSLKWASTQQLGKSCGAYRSVVAPLPGNISARVGKSSPTKPDYGSFGQDAKEPGSSMLIYSNYNFLDVKLELQIRSSDGTLTEKPMQGTFSPPGLRFPNGGVIDTNFVVSGTYLTSSKQEYALWALDLRTLTWSRIDAGGNVFSQGSWNRGVLWSRRNTFVILGNRKRSLVEDYNHRRINFSNVCMVELEAFGLYDNPRRATPMSGFVSASAPFAAPSLSLSLRAGWTAGGRTLSKAAEELGQSALGLRELADMDILCVGGERIPVNSRVVARRWGAYFVQLLREGAATQDGNDSATLRPENMFRNNNPSRNSSITITPSVGNSSSNMSTSSTLNNTSTASISSGHQSVEPSTLYLPPDSSGLAPTSRPRTLYLPHTHLTIHSLLHYLYTSSLPPSPSPLCTPQILCSLLQLARPYKIDGLLEAVVERLHGVLDSRNAAAVFNASAMAAGGGRATSLNSAFGENWLSTDFADVPGGSSNASPPTTQLGAIGGDPNSRSQLLRINTSVGGISTGSSSRRADDEESLSASSSVASDALGSDVSGGMTSDAESRNDANGKEIWKGDISAVIGLQKRGLRGLMEGRRLRERGGSVPHAPGPRVGLGIGAS